MSQTILATKNGLKKKFELTSWNLLKDKNGWVPVSEQRQIVENVQRQKEIPDSGQKKTVDVQFQKVSSETLPVANNPQNIENEATLSVDDVFASFVNKNLSKSSVKDFLDQNNIPYKNTMSLEKGLTEILSKHFGNDVEKLKVEFNESNNSL